MKCSSFTTFGSKFIFVLGMAFALISHRAPANSLFIGDTSYGVVREYDGDTGAYRGVFASGGGLTSPQGLAIGSDGKLYVSDYSSKSILRYDGKTGAFIDKFATTSNFVYSIVFGPDSNLYAGISGGAIQRFNGTNGNSLGYFTQPFSDFGGLLFHDGSLFVTYPGSVGYLYRYNATNGSLISVLHNGFTGNGPRGMVFGPDGSLYVAEWQTPRVAKFDAQTFAFKTNIINDPFHSYPMALAFGPDGRFYVLDDSASGTASVNRYNLQTGAFESQFVAPGSGGLGRARSMLFVESPHAPLLKAGPVGRAVGLQTLTLSWTNTCPTCVLEGAATVSGPWTNISSQWSTNANTVSTVVTCPNPSGFYRLRMN